MTVRQLSRPAAKAAHDAGIVPIFIQFRHQPTEGLNNSPRLNSQRQLLSSAIALAHGSGACDRTREHFVPRKAVATIAPQGGRMTFGELSWIIVKSLDLVGLSQHERQR